LNRKADLAPAYGTHELRSIRGGGRKVRNLMSELVDECVGNEHLKNVTHRKLQTDENMREGLSVIFLHPPLLGVKTSQLKVDNDSPQG